MPNNYVALRHTGSIFRMLYHLFLHSRPRLLSTKSVKYRPSIYSVIYIYFECIYFITIKQYSICTGFPTSHGKVGLGAGELYLVIAAQTNMLTMWGPTKKNVAEEKEKKDSPAGSRYNFNIRSPVFVGTQA